MALFTDGPLSDIEDLTAHDSQVLIVASGEGVDVTRKLALAHDEIGLELEALLSNLNGSSIPAGHGLENVVSTNALKLWHSCRALELVYADAYNVQLNDRYAGRRDQFCEKAKWARGKLFETGIGMTDHPVPRATPPAVQPTAGLALPNGTYFVTIGWVGDGGAEGACALPVAVDLLGTTLQVFPPAAPDRVTGWNVYIGSEVVLPMLQNAAPIAVTQAWLQTGPLTAGRPAGTGQSPDYLKPVRHILQRG